MPFIERPWLRQPPSRGRLQLSDTASIAQGIRIAAVGSRALPLPFNDIALTRSGIDVTNGQGLARQFNGSTTYDSYDLSYLTGAASGTPASIGLVFKLRSVSGTQRLVSAGFQSTTGGMALSPSTTTHRVIAVDNGGSNVTLSFANALAVGPLYTTVVTAATQLNGYHSDGTTVSGAITGGIKWTSADFFRLGTDDVAASPSNLEVALAVLWLRELPAGEAWQFVANPWSIFAPRRVWVPVAAADGGSAISAAAGAATTSALTGSSFAASTASSAAGAATASAMAGASVAASSISTAAGATTASSLVGSSVAVASFSAAAGTSTASTMAGATGEGSTIGAAAGAATASALAGSSVAAAAVASAAGASSAAAATGSSIAAATMSPASGSSSASACAGSSVATGAIAAASGASSAQIAVGSAFAAAAIGSATGASTTSTLGPAFVGASAPPARVWAVPRQLRRWAIPKR